LQPQRLERRSRIKIKIIQMVAVSKALTLSTLFFLQVDKSYLVSLSVISI
jgi:hypothetical protein